MKENLSFGASEEATARAALAVSSSSPNGFKPLRHALSEALSLPDLEFVTQRDHYSPTPGRLLDEAGGTISANWRDWIAGELASTDGDAVSVWEKYREKAWITTEWRPAMHYFSGKTGSRAWDFQQVRIRAHQEFTSRRLFSQESWYRPNSPEELLDGNCAGAAVEIPAALGPIQYQLEEVVDFGRFVDLGTQLYADLTTNSANRLVTIRKADGSEQVGRLADLVPEVRISAWSGLRWFNDWAFSSAGRVSGEVWKRWAFKTGRSDLGGRPLLSMIPIWSHLGNIGKVSERMLNDHELYGRLLKLCDRTGKVPFHYFFYGLHGNLVRASSLMRILNMAERGEIMLPEHDYQVLKSWSASPYSF